MGRVKLTDRKKKAIATHRRIYNTALKLFEKHGFDNITVDEICRKARVAKGTFYVYFESKDHVVIELFLKNDERVNAIAATELAAVEDPLEKLSLLMRKAFTNHVKEGPDIMEVSYRARASLGRTGNPRPIESRASYKTVLSLIEEAQAQGKIRADLGAGDIAHLILRAMEGVLHDWSINNGQFNLVTEAERMGGVLLIGLRVR
jgi:AcrR family transcriptional regulator